MKKVELEAQIKQLKEENANLESKLIDMKVQNNSETYELGKSLKHIIDYTLNGMELKLDVYGSILDGVREAITDARYERDHEKYRPGATQDSNYSSDSF